jgi:hypothetical protein
MMPEDTESSVNKQDNAPDEGFRRVGPHFTPLAVHCIVPLLKQGTLLLNLIHKCFERTE